MAGNREADKRETLLFTLGENQNLANWQAITMDSVQKQGNCVPNISISIPGDTTQVSKLLNSAYFWLFVW